MSAIGTVEGEAKGGGSSSLPQTTTEFDGIPGANTYKAEHRICAYAVNRAF
ncbi:hypothetical protein [Corallococcus sp. CA054B]|uniref:hypothetical protein n=1 Tax=Corallococcus sp. CA054B TaxID=2316734 RepID=UPI0013151A4B|nr:hypothetical protein [Corallococcus sp. CA054B]